MATSTRKRKASREDVYKARKALWETLGVEGWLKYLQQYCPNTTWKRSDSVSIIANCPFHEDSNPSFRITLSKGLAKCFSSSCGRTFTDPIEFLATISEEKYSTVLKQLVDDIPTLPTALKDDIAFVEEQYTTNILKNYLYRAFKECMSDARKARNSTDEASKAEFRYTDSVLRWLDFRSVPEAYWHTVPIGVFPTEKHLEHYFVELFKRPDLLPLAKNYLKIIYEGGATWLGALAFFYHSSPEQVCRIKLRLPTDTQVSSSTKREHNEIFIKEEDDASVPRGFFGLEAIQGLRSDSMCIYVVEGEFDQISIQLASLGAYNKPGEPVNPHREVVIAVGGTYHNCLDPLFDLSYQELRLVMDHPSAGGIGVIKEIIKQTKIPFDFKIFNWPPDVSAKDPDLAIKTATIGPITFLNSIYDEVNFLSTRDWILAQIEVELKSSTRLDPEKNKITMIQEYSKIFKDVDQYDLFVTSACNRFAIDESSITCEVAVAFDPETFIAALMRLIKKEYTILGTETSENSCFLHVWAKRKKEERRLCGSRPLEVGTIMSADVGHVYEWIQTNIGIPQFIADSAMVTKDGAKERSFEDKTTKLGVFICYAIQQLNSEVPAMKDLLKKKTGAHILTVDGMRKIFFNNAGQLFEGDFEAITKGEGEATEIIGHRVNWSERDFPSVANKYFFELTPDPWSVHTKVEHLNACNSINKKELNKIFEGIVDVIDTGWKFKNGLLDPTILAAFSMVVPVSTIFPKAPMLYITGEKSSGKTKLSLGIFAGALSNIPGLLEPVEHTVNTTSAGLYQLLAGMAKLMIIDEFESRGVDKNTEIRNHNLQNIIRSGTDGSTVHRGSASSKVVKYQMSVPFLLSAITLPDDQANASRVIPIWMEHHPRYTDPSVSIYKKFTQEFLDMIRAKTTIALFSHIPELQKTMRAVQDMYSGGNNVYASSRFLEFIMPEIALIRYLGRDDRQFVEQFCLSKEDFFSTLSQDHSDDYRMDILSSVYVYDKDINEGNGITLEAILRNPIYLQKLNGTNKGVLYFEKIPGAGLERQKHWLLVHWPTVMTSILRGNPRFFNVTVPAAKQSTIRSKYVVSDKIYKTAGTFRRRWGLETSTYSEYNVTIYSVADIMDKINTDALKHTEEVEQVAYGTYNDTPKPQPRRPPK